MIRSSVPVGDPPPHTAAAEEPISLSAALTMSLEVGEMEPAIAAVTSATQAPHSLGVAIEAVPAHMSVDLRAKLIICMIHMSVPMPEVSEATPLLTLTTGTSFRIS